MSSLSRASALLFCGLAVFEIVLTFFFVDGMIIWAIAVLGTLAITLWRAFQQPRRFELRQTTAPLAIFLRLIAAIGLIGGASLFALALNVARIALTGDDIIGNGRGNPCQIRDIAREESPNHAVQAVVREANCPFYFEQGKYYYLVFVRKGDEKIGTWNLALQYMPLERSTAVNGPTPAPPIAKWISGAELLITIPGPLDEVPVQRTIVNEVLIRYQMLGDRRSR